MQVTRNRRHAQKLNRRIVVAGAAVLAVVGGSGAAYASTRGLGTEQAGHTYGGNLVTSSDQVIRPIGDRLVINNGKIMTDTVSPDGSHLAALTADGGIAL